MSDKTGRRPDPLYDGIARLRRQNRRRVLGAVLIIIAIIVALSALVAVLIRR
jgi:hypothetical protein